MELSKEDSFSRMLAILGGNNSSQGENVMACGVLDNAKKKKEDEFYTQLSDIEKELKHYKSQFKNKTVFCNCDDPEYSSFFYFFVSNFDEFGLKKLITTHFETDKQSYKLEYDGGADVRGDKDTVVKRAIKSGKKSKLKQNYEQGSQLPLFEEEPVRSYSGDFRSPECIELLKQSDIVVTNPPFSLFREFVSTLEEYNKKYLIIGNKNALTYKEIFALIKSNKIRIGFRNINQDMWFILPDDTEKWEKIIDGKKTKPIMACWFTNLEVSKHHQDLVLYKHYTPEEFPTFENYDAINVDVVNDIPMDYKGIIGAPITYIGKHNPEQFEIVALGIVGSCDFSNERKMEILDKNGAPTGKFTINAKGALYRKFNPEKDNRPAYKDAETGQLYSSIYARILIKNKRIEQAGMSHNSGLKKSQEKRRMRACLK